MRNERTRGDKTAYQLLNHVIFVRFRRIRDKYALTQAGKAANRMTFAELGEDEFQVEAQAQRVVKQKGQVRVPLPW